MAQSSLRQVHRLDTITNNIANVNSPGFKAEGLYFSQKGSVGTNEFGGERVLQSSMQVYDFSNGIIQKTDNMLDLAITGEGFFTIQTRDGEAYTRDGRFTLNSDGELVTQNGDYVVGESGKIVISGKDVQIDQQGKVCVDGQEVDRLKIADFREADNLVKTGFGLFVNPENRAVRKNVEEPEIHSGFLELSNVQAINEMVELLNIQRTHESYQKVIQTIDEQDELSTGRLGKLR